MRDSISYLDNFLVKRNEEAGEILEIEIDRLLTIISLQIKLIKRD